MKFNRVTSIIAGCFLLFAVYSCASDGNSAAVAPEATPAGAGQSGVQDNVSGKDVVKVAVGSPDHTTLVTALKAAELVDALSNAGPFTVFAPVNAAFDKLPAGTVEGLLKPDKKETLQDILQYHVAVAVYKEEMLQDGQSLSMANGGTVTIGRKDGKITVNGASVLAAVPATNGLVYVIDGVLLPQ
jgi:uncharacterized surface protein with fasciclin (FAS1) repeats